MNKLSLTIVAALVLSASLTAQARSTSPLAPGRRVYVVHAARRDDLADALTKELKGWGRWVVVDRPADADLIATIAGDGSKFHGHVTVVFKTGIDGPVVWQAEDTGHRVYSSRSPYLRALDVVLAQLRDDATRWPVE